MSLMAVEKNDFFRKNRQKGSQIGVPLTRSLYGDLQFFRDFQGFLKIQPRSDATIKVSEASASV